MGYQELKFELPKVRDMKTKLIFLVHFFLIFLAVLGSWAPWGYVIYSSIYLYLLLILCLQVPNEENVFMSLTVNVISILLDIIFIAVHFPDNRLAATPTNEFSAVMAIFNLFFRLYSCHSLYGEWCFVCGTTGVSVSNINPGGHPGHPGHPDAGTVRSTSVLNHYPGIKAEQTLPPGYTISN